MFDEERDQRPADTPARGQGRTSRVLAWIRILGGTCMACGLITRVAFELILGDIGGRIEMGRFAELEGACFAGGLLLFLLHLVIRPRLKGFLLWLFGGAIAAIVVLSQMPP